MPGRALSSQAAPSLRVPLPASAPDFAWVPRAAGATTRAKAARVPAIPSVLATWGLGRGVRERGPGSPGGSGGPGASGVSGVQESRKSREPKGSTGFRGPRAFEGLRGSSGVQESQGAQGIPEFREPRGCGRSGNPGDQRIQQS